MKHDIGEYAFFHPVRVPREILSDARSFKMRSIIQWTARICDSSKQIGDPVSYVIPDIEDYNKIVICGDGPNTAIAARLVRKAIIEISNDTFDAQDMTEVREQAFEDFKNEQNQTDPKLPTYRVDFKFDLNSMNVAQTESFDKLKALFNRLGIMVSRVENRPSVIELCSPDTEALKGAKLTAAWAAKTIGQQQPITNNRLVQSFGTQSIQALGRERGNLIARRALG